MQTDKVFDKQYELLEEFINEQPEKRGALIAVLHHAQELFGYLPDDVQLFIARRLEMPAAKVYGVVSFYSYFNTVPQGDYTISICMGTACFVRGSEKILDEFKKQLNLKQGQISEDGKFSFKSIRCVGACGLAPVVMVNDHVYGRVKKEDVAGILAECKGEGDGNE